MQSSVDREKLRNAYEGAGSSPSEAIARCGAGLALVCAVATGGVSPNTGDARHDQAREAVRGRLSIEQPGIAHAREVYAGRRAGRVTNNLDLLVRK
jgi:hypothetical protein